MEEAVRVLSVIMTPLIITGILIMEPFLRWWVGQDMARNAAYVGEILAAGFWFNGLSTIPFARLQAEGRPDIIAKFHLAEIIPYIAFLAFAMHTWGVVGAALAWSIRVAVDAILLFYASRVTLRSFIAHLPPLFFLGFASVAVYSFPLASPLRWATGACAFLGSLVWAWSSAPPSVKRLIVVRNASSKFA
jgi:O-antigen/teichoic acid export membrane protein